MFPGGVAGEEGETDQRGQWKTECLTSVHGDVLYEACVEKTSSVTPMDININVMITYVSSRGNALFQPLYSMRISNVERGKLFIACPVNLRLLRTLNAGVFLHLRDLDKGATYSPSVSSVCAWFPDYVAVDPSIPSILFFDEVSDRPSSSKLHKIISGVMRSVKRPFQKKSKRHHPSALKNA